LNELFQYLFDSSGVVIFTGIILYISDPKGSYVYKKIIIKKAILKESNMIPAEPCIYLLKEKLVFSGFL